MGIFDGFTDFIGDLGRGIGTGLTNIGRQVGGQLPGIATDFLRQKIGIGGVPGAGRPARRPTGGGGPGAGRFTPGLSPTPGRRGGRVQFTGNLAQDFGVPMAQDMRITFRPTPGMGGVQVGAPDDVTFPTFQIPQLNPPRQAGVAGQLGSLAVSAAGNVLGDIFESVIPGFPGFPSSASAAAPVQQLPVDTGGMTANAEAVGLANQGTAVLGPLEQQVLAQVAAGEAAGKKPSASTLRRKIARDTGMVTASSARKWAKAMRTTGLADWAKIADKWARALGRRGSRHTHKAVVRRNVTHRHRRRKVYAGHTHGTPRRKRRRSSSSGLTAAQRRFRAAARKYGGKIPRGTRLK